MKWVNMFETNGSIVDNKYGPPKTVTIPENVARVREAFMLSPHWSINMHEFFQIS